MMLLAVLQKYRLGKQSGKDMGEASRDGGFCYDSLSLSFQLCDVDPVLLYFNFVSEFLFKNALGAPFACVCVCTHKKWLILEI